MAKTSKEPADGSSLRHAIATFTKQTDRGSALIAAAWVDDALEQYLRAFFRPDQKTADEILQPEGPLGSFAARIKLAYLLGLIEPTARQDLEIIRRIRNEFAHVRQQIRFTDRSLRARCRRLHAAHAFNVGTGASLRSPRQMFLISAYFLTDYLFSLAETAKLPRFLDGDMYGSYVRRFAKSMSLTQLQGALEKMEEASNGPLEPK